MCSTLLKDTYTLRSKGRKEWFLIDDNFNWNPNEDKALKSSNPSMLVGQRKYQALPI